MEQSNADGSPSPTPTDCKINVKILSPSNEIPDKLTITDCPTSTTIAELKSKICDAVETRPAPERQRLIYRGKPLLRDYVTLRDILPQDEIATSSDHSLHLVLPPSVAPQSSSHPATQFQPNVQRPPHPVAQQPGAPPYLPSGERGMPHVHVAPPHNRGGPIPSGPFPPHLQQALNNHLQALNQQIATQMASHAGPIGQQQLNPLQVQDSQHFQLHQSSFQQAIAQQQQARASAGQQGLGNNTPTQINMENNATPGQNIAASAFAPPNGHHLRASTPTNVNTVVRDNQGLHGEGWRMVIQSTSTVTAPNPHLPRIPTPVNLGQFPPPPNLVQIQTPGQLQLRVLEYQLSMMQSALSRGEIPAATVFESARGMLRNVEASEGELRLRSWLDQLRGRADEMRSNLNNMSLSATSELLPRPAATQFEPSNPHPPQNTEQSSVYLLSSPSGPQALLISPSGTYSTLWHVPGLAGAGLPWITQPTHSPSAANASNAHVPLGIPQQPRHEPVGQAHADPQPQPQQQQNQPANEAHDLLRLLIPLGGHIWLLIRLFGFVYFFTAGGGSRRAILLGGFAFVLFVAQTGIFRPLVQSLWEPLRRHVEGLLPVPGNGPAPAPNPGAGEQNRPETGAIRQDQQPTTQQAAARLLEEQQRRDTSVLREQIRRVERALALFVGSLVPGFGERHIAAREAAEAAQQAESRQREETARREEEQRNLQASNDGNSERESQNDPEPTAQGQGQSQTARAPLVEI